jgi:hypothetical protein
MFVNKPTCTYASHVISAALSQNSQFHTWAPVTVPELKKILRVDVCDCDNK